MYLGKVIGTVVCSIKDEALTGRKLLLVERLSGSGTVVAVDAVGAGVGETVYVCRGREAAFAFKPEEVPTESTIVAIVDQVYEEPALPLAPREPAPSSQTEDSRPTAAAPRPVRPNSRRK